MKTINFVAAACLIASSSGQHTNAQGSDEPTLAGKWNVRLIKTDGSVKPVDWDIRLREDAYEAQQSAFTFTFAKRGTDTGQTSFAFTMAMKYAGQVTEGTCTLSKDGNRFEGVIPEATGPRRVWTATRNDRAPGLPHGLYLQAGEAAVRSGKTVSVPIYLRYNGPAGVAPAPANMNFELTYDSSVVKVVPHPQSERISPSKETSEAPDLPRGNLPERGALLAGNAKKSGIVLAGFAGKSGVRPGVGQPGETVTEIYFQAVGQPGDETKLDLAVTMINDPQGDKVSISAVPGHICILDDSLPLGPPGPSGPGQQPNALDAYKALLMSINRLSEDLYLDVSKDGQVTSRDSTLILQMTVEASRKIVSRGISDAPRGNLTGGCGSYLLPPTGSGDGPSGVRTTPPGPGSLAGGTGTGSDHTPPGAGSATGGEARPGGTPPGAGGATGGGTGTGGDHTRPGTVSAASGGSGTGGTTPGVGVGTGGGTPTGSNQTTPGAGSATGRGSDPGGTPQGAGSATGGGTGPGGTSPGAGGGIGGGGGTSDQPLSPPGGRLTALDAYRALLMSVERLPKQPLYDRNQDGSVDSRDSLMILKGGRAGIGE